MKFRKIAATFIAMLTVCGAAVIPADIMPSVQTEIFAQAATNILEINAASGNGSSDIQNAINSLAKYGGTIKLTGNFTLDSMLTMYNCNNLTIDAQKAVISSDLKIALNPWQAKNITIKGGKWKMGNNSQLAKVSSSENCTFDSLNISGGNNTEGVLYYYCSADSSVKNCVFNNTLSQAVYVYKSSDFAAVGNSVSNAGGHAIGLYGSEKPLLLGNTVNNICGDGLKCVECNNAVISGNTVKNIKWNEKLDYDEGKGQARSGCGIMVMSSENIQAGKATAYAGRNFEGNIVSGTANYGMVINLCSDTLVKNISFSDIDTNGIHNSASSGTVIEGCTFKNCKETGIFFVPGPDEKVSAVKRQALGSVIRNNTIDSCGTFGVDLVMTDGTNVNENIVRNCTDYGLYCIAAKNISIVGNDTFNTKTYKGSGINFNEACSNIIIRDPAPLTLSSTGMNLGAGEKTVLKCSDSSVKWRTSDYKIVSVDQKGNVTAINTGTAWVTVRTDSGKERSCKFTVKKAPEKIVLTKGILTLGVGEKYTIGSSVNDGAACLQRIYRTSNSSIVKMTRTNWVGDFVAQKPGVAYVTVRSYNGKESTCKVTVKNAPSYVTISKKTLVMKVGQSASLSANVGNAGCAERTFRTSNSSVVRMTKTNWTGSFTAVKKGIAYVTVRTYNGKESSCKITVV